MTSHDPNLTEELQRLRAENEALKEKAKGGPRGLSFRVSPKGAVSVYGLGRFPVTLYKEQWEKLLGLTSELQQFLKDHQAELKVKME